MFQIKAQNRGKKLICILLTIVILLISIPMNMLAALDNEEDNLFITFSDSISFEVEATITSTWDMHANVDVKIRNVGEEDIHNWCFIFENPYSIENIWNAEIVENKDNLYMIKNSGYNQELRVNEEINIGMTIVVENEINVTRLTNRWYLNTKEVLLDCRLYEVTYTEYASWDGGFNGALQIINKSGEEIRNWSLNLDSNLEITTVNQAVLQSKNANNYIISNDGYTTNIGANSSVSLGIQGIKYNDDLQLRNVEMYCYVIDSSLDSDEDGNGVLDILEKFYGIEVTPEITSTPEISEEVTPTIEIIEEITPTIAEEITEEPTKEVTPTDEVINTTSPIDYEDKYAFIDSDGDGLSDEEEYFLMTDPYDSDTDDDGISDFIEVEIAYNPNNKDTDCDGMLDGDEDYDGDGLSNLYELNIGTCIYAKDSDYDRLDDSDEINVYYTNPRDEDTDGDGISDYNEIFLGKNPLDINDSDIKINQKKSSSDRK